MAEFSTYQRRLPHLRLDGAMYFVTWRLAPWQPLLTAAERTLVADALKHFNGDRYRLTAFVVMDDHVHVIVSPFGPHALERILHSWKSFTANRLQRQSGRAGRVWQDEYHERAVRDDGELMQKVQYVLQNPSKRWPEIGEYEWVWVE